MKTRQSQKKRLLSERSQTLRNEITRAGKSRETERRFVVDTGCGEGGDGRWLRKVQERFQGEEQVVKLEKDGGCTTLWCTKRPWTVCFKLVVLWISPRLNKDQWDTENTWSHSALISSPPQSLPLTTSTTFEDLKENASFCPTAGQSHRL